MLHAPYMQVEVNSKSLSENAALLAQLQDIMLKIYSEKTGTSIEAMGEILNKETYFNADQALKAGLVTSIASDSVIPTRSPSTLNTLPHGVVAALFGAGSGGNNQVEPKEIPMTTTVKVAATAKQIKAAFPKAKADFIVRCMEKEMAMEDVAAEMTEELMEENQTLSAQVKAMEDELNALRAKAQEEQMVAKAKAEEEEMAAKAKAKSGIKPVSQGVPAGVSARAKWNEAIDSFVAKGLTRQKAVVAVNKNHPGLREQLLSEANG
jgi:hypothetical protein